MSYAGTTPQTRRAFSMLELAMAIAFLSLGIMASLGMASSIHQDREGLRRQAVAVSVAQLVAGRIQAAPWSKLGNDVWLMHRRASPAPGGTTALNPAMNERDLINFFFIDKSLGAANTINEVHSLGITNLRIYIEYYRMALLDSMNDPAALASQEPTKLWRSIVGNEITRTVVGGISQGTAATDALTDELMLPETPFYPDDELKVQPTGMKKDDGLVIRVLVSWIPAGVNESLDPEVAPRLWHQVVFGRRP